jgi:hypothetical protein
MNTLHKRIRKTPLTRDLVDILISPIRLHHLDFSIAIEKG